MNDPSEDLFISDTNTVKSRGTLPMGCSLADRAFLNNVVGESSKVR